MPSKTKRSRSEMAGKRFGDLRVLEYVRSPDFFVCECDCGERIVQRVSVIARQMKADIPINCGICQPKPKRKSDKRSNKSTANMQPDETPPPPCEKNGGCLRRDVCNMKELACLDFYRYVMGKPYGSGGEPIADLFAMAFSA